VKSKAFVWFCSALLVLGAVMLAWPRLTAAGPNRSPHPVRSVNAPHPPHSTRPPRGGTPTPTAGIPPTATPGSNGQACPAQPTFRLLTKVSKLFYAYPGTERTLRASGFFRVDQTVSNGISPATENASLTLTDDDGVIILSMPSLQFQAMSDGSFAASNDQGFVLIAPFAGAYSFRFQFDHPNFAPGFFRVRYHLCMNIGDDGISEQIVCQPKNNDGFLCHM